MRQKRRLRRISAQKVFSCPTDILPAAPTLRAWLSNLPAGSKTTTHFPRGEPVPLNAARIEPPRAATRSWVAQLLHCKCQLLIVGQLFARRCGRGHGDCQRVI